MEIEVRAPMLPPPTTCSTTTTRRRSDDQVAIVPSVLSVVSNTESIPTTNHKNVIHPLLQRLPVSAKNDLTRQSNIQDATCTCPCPCTPASAATATITTDEKNDAYHDSDCYYFVTLFVHQSRILWYGLIPILYESSSDLSYQALLYILRNSTNMIQQQQQQQQPTTTTVTSRRIKSSISTYIPTTTLSPSSPSSSSSSSSSFIQHYNNCNTMQMVRSFTLPRKKNNIISNRKSKRTTANDTSTGTTTASTKLKQKIVLLLQPPINTMIEYTNNNVWMKNLLRYEQLLIRAQSISGYIATLGGGYFLCHHYRTAIALAQYQQYLAILLNDIILFYTTFIHMSYSYIYNGQFTSAQSMLRQLYNVINHQRIIKMTSSSSSSSSSSSTTITSKFDVVLKMCQSAQLFNRRMRRYYNNRNSTSSTTTIGTKKLPLAPYTNTTTIAVPTNRIRYCSVDETSDPIRTNNIHDNTNNTTNVSNTIDNYQRIRIVQDQSKPDDFVVPFSKATVRT